MSRLIFQTLDTQEKGCIESENILFYISKLSDAKKYPSNMIHDINQTIWNELLLLVSAHTNLNLAKEKGPLQQQQNNHRERVNNKVIFVLIFCFF